MRSPLQRLYQTKLALLATISTVAGIGFLVLAHWSSQSPAGAWLVSLPITELGAALFTTGLVAIFFEYVDQEAADERATERLRAVLTEEAPAMRDAVIQGFAFNADDMARVSSPAVLDDIARNVLSLQLGDRDLGEYAYMSLRNQVIRAPERWRDLSVSVALAPWANGPASGPGSMFVATLRWEYRVVPGSSVVRFACVADRSEYRELLSDPSMASVWYFGQPPGVDASSPEAFELVQFMVNGRARPIRRTARVGSQLYTVSMPRRDGEEVTISCTYRVLIQRHGHLLALDLPRPTKGVRIELAYGEAGIRRVNTVDFIAGTEQVYVSRSPESVPTPTVGVTYDGWTLPRSGVVFGWVLEEEVAGDAERSEQAG